MTYTVPVAESGKRRSFDGQAGPFDGSRRAVPAMEPPVRRGRLRQIFATGLFLFFAVAGAFADSPIAPVNTEGGLAIKGYDPVSYFTIHRPTAGLAQFSASYKGARYRFASAVNRGRFIAEPEKFVPQYGGYCALAMALNQIADIDPEDWAIVNDKLYLNNGFIAQALWSLDKSGNIAAGDRNWPLLPKLPEPSN